MKKNFMHKNGIASSWLGRLIFFLMTISFLGCVAAIPVVIYYEEEHKGFVVTVQLDKNADKVYQTALELIENPSKEALPDLIEVTNIKKDEKNLSVTFDATFKDGVHHDKVNVTAINANRAQFIAVADTPGDKKADESSALTIIRAVCNKMGVKYKVVKG